MAQSIEFPVQQDEQMLLQQLAHGDTSTFWELWLRHKDYLFRICLQFMGNSHQDADDLLSEIMLKAFEKLPAYAHDIRNLKAWLARFARNYCIDVHRKRQREAMKMCEIEPDMHIASAAGDQQPLESATERPQVEDLLSKLSLSQQEVIVNRFIQGKPYDEISKHLNISPTTVRKRVQRAREILRREGAVLARCATGGGR